MTRRLAIAVALVVAACGGSPPPPSSTLFACGAQSCDAATSYCEMIKTDVPALPSTYACRTLPGSCAQQTDCGCFPAGTRCGYCVALQHDGAHHFQRTCIGGR